MADPKIMMWHQWFVRPHQRQEREVIPRRDLRSELLQTMRPPKKARDYLQGLFPRKSLSRSGRDTATFEAQIARYILKGMQFEMSGTRDRYQRYYTSDDLISRLTGWGDFLPLDSYLPKKHEYQHDEQTLLVVDKIVSRLNSRGFDGNALIDDSSPNYALEQSRIASTNYVQVPASEMQRILTLPDDPKMDRLAYSSNLKASDLTQHEKKLLLFRLAGRSLRRQGTDSPAHIGAISELRKELFPDARSMDSLNLYALMSLENYYEQYTVGALGRAKYPTAKYEFTGDNVAITDRLDPDQRKVVLQSFPWFADTFDFGAQYGKSYGADMDTLHPDDNYPFKANWGDPDKIGYSPALEEYYQKHLQRTADLQKLLERKSVNAFEQDPQSVTTLIPPQSWSSAREGMDFGR